MFDDIDHVPAFVDHFVLVKADDFIQVTPTGIEKPAYLESSASRLVDKGF